MVEIRDNENAKAAIYHALSSEYCVLEFKELDSGEMQIIDITEHVKELENESH